MFLDKNVNTEVLHFCSNGLFGIEVTVSGRRKFPFGESISGRDPKLNPDTRPQTT